MNAQKNLNRTTQGLGQTYERLSSGLRINRARDDAAGLAVADTLLADTRIATVAIRNAAETRIRDVDVAETAAELTRLNILQQAGAAVLSQANNQPSLALQLLGG